MTAVVAVAVVLAVVGCGSSASSGRARAAVDAARDGDPASVTAALSAYGQAVHANAASGTVTGLREQVGRLVTGGWAIVEATVAYGAGPPGCGRVAADYSSGQPRGTTPAGSIGDAGQLALSFRELGGDRSLSAQVVATAEAAAVPAGATTAVAALAFSVTALGRAQGPNGAADLYDAAHAFVNTRNTGEALTAATLAFDAGTDHATICLGG